MLNCSVNTGNKPHIATDMQSYFLHGNSNAFTGKLFNIYLFTALLDKLVIQM